MGQRSRYDSPTLSLTREARIIFEDGPPQTKGLLAGVEREIDLMSSFCSKSFQRKVTWVASVALVAQPQLLTAAQPAAITPTANTRQVVEAPHDVALADGGTVTGQVVDTAGKPQANMPVTLNSSNKEIARVHTDAEGNFRVASLQGGVYHVATNGNEGVYRFWAPRTAPPGSQTGLNLVSGQNVYRGQVGRWSFHLDRPVDCRTSDHDSRWRCNGDSRAPGPAR